MRKRRPRRSGWATIAGVCVLLALALLMRLDGITGPPIGISETLTIRQYHSALLARSYYVRSQSSAPAWQRQVAQVIGREQPPIEPPLMEHVAAVAYRVAGGEKLWIPRLLSSLFWLAGGLAVYRLARRIASSTGSLASLAVYLFLPFAVHASRSFQPDPLMVALMCVGALAIVRYHERAEVQRLLVSSAVAGAAGFVKPPVALFFLVPMFASLAASAGGWKRSLRNRDLWAFATLATIPSIAYYAYSVLVTTYLAGDVSEKLQPSLWFEASYWRGWGDKLLGIVALHQGPIAVPSALVILLAAAVGVALAQGRGRAMLLGLWTGYVLFGLAFTAHISTHDYYSLPLVPIVALSLAPAATRFLDWIRRWPAPARLVAALAACAGVPLAFLAAHNGLASVAYRNQAAEYARIGVIVHHSPSVIVLSGDLGLAVEYEGWFGGRFWPLRASQGLHGIPASARFTQHDEHRYYPAVAGMRPPAQYFVVTVLPELHGQPDLERYLRRFRVIASNDQFVVYDLRRSRRSS
jgi:hypothetical protein